MKRILISGCLSFFIFVGTQAVAQEKVKEKEDKTKIKDKDANYKEKDKADKTKIKDGDSKVKVKNPDGTMQNSNGAQNATGAMQNSDPYAARYSSNFAIGNPAHAKIILDLWKDWDDNAFDRHDYFADTLVMYLPDGSVVKGKAANMEGAKKYRGGMTSSKSSIDAWMPLRSTDRNEDWVAIWGTETDTWADGKSESKDIHEIWRINKDGKIDMMKQFTAKSSSMAPGQ